MGMNMCLFCEHCDSERTNDLEQVRCKKFSTYVDPLNGCDYFTNKETSFERIKNMSVEELADMLTVELVGLQPCKLFQALPTEKTYISKKAAVQDVENWLESEAEE